MPAIALTHVALAVIAILRRAMTAIVRIALVDALVTGFTSIQGVGDRSQRSNKPGRRLALEASRARN
jgi:hypothetical protein